MMTRDEILAFAKRGARWCNEDLAFYKKQNAVFTEVAEEQMDFYLSVIRELDPEINGEDDAG